MAFRYGSTEDKEIGNADGSPSGITFKIKRAYGPRARNQELVTTAFRERDKLPEEDRAALTRAFLAEVVVGWSGVETSNGDPAEWNVEDAFEQLPEDVLGRLQIYCLTGKEEREEEAPAMVPSEEPAPAVPDPTPAG
jgi:hypothetical protein